MTWDEALRAVCKNYRGKEFVRGTFDCCTFVAEYVLERTGKDYSSSFEYDSTEGAEAILAQHGGMVGLISSCLGEPTTPEVGSVVVCHVTNLHVTGVYNGSYVLSFLHDHGLVRLPMRSIIAAWTV